MKKHNILYVSGFILLSILFISKNVVASSLATPKNQVSAIVEILQTLDISKSKIDAIKAILESENVDTVPIAPSAGFDKKTGQPLTGCENNAKFNTSNGNKCNSYIAPKPATTPKTPIKKTSGTSA